MASVQEILHAKLNSAFAPVDLEVRDDSHLHAGHAGARPEGETHFSVHIVADAFCDISRVQRHRMINKTLADELAGPVHALAINAHAPGEKG
jgi:BolA protein